ncbi:MAG: chitobiase/beta-hexosaminidase C-terminal domain-containing protein, partial [Deltaproteobacteria bacterium]|nr:chitobiase/beta-hexosaminidase C-terminal domain-containing protein [Deltaproteobacteria bacterium]
MKTKILALAVMILFFFPNSGASGSTYVNVISREFVNVNEIFYVNVSIEPSSPLGGAQCDISFDPSVLEVESVNDGGMFEKWWDANLDIDNVNGTIRNMVAYNFEGNGTTGNGIFAVLMFKAKSVGSSYLNLGNVIVSDENGDEILSAASDGLIMVVNDTALPIISYSLSPSVPDGDNGWYKSNVDATLNATDNNGIAEMKYNVDGSVWQDYTTPFTISTDGQHTVQFYAIDNAGNNNSTSFNVNMDREAPVLSHSLSGTAGNNGWYKSNVQVTLNPSDTISGIDTIMYRTNGGTWHTYTAPFTLSSGQYTVDYYAIDNAGNNNSTAFSLKIDSTSPSSSASLSGTKEGDVYTTDVTVSISRTDSTSGIAYTKYR